MKRGSQYPTDALFKGLRVLLTSLPTDEEKSELLNTLREAGNFIEELRALVEEFPTAESNANLAQGLSRLSILANRTAKDTHLRKIMGLRSSEPQIKSGNGADSKARVEELARKMENVENSDLISLLERSGEPLAVLKDLAASLGLRTRSKERKADLIRRIATHVTNQRGYRILRGEG